MDSEDSDYDMEFALLISTNGNREEGFDALIVSNVNVSYLNMLSLFPILKVQSVGPNFLNL